MEKINLDAGISVLGVTLDAVQFAISDFMISIAEIEVDFPDVNFVHVKNSSRTEIMEFFELHGTKLRSVPTALIFKDGKLRCNLSGADMKTLAQTLTTLTGENDEEN